MLSTILVTAGPAGTIAMYIPVESMVTVCVAPELLVITTLTPGIPGSPGSWMPLAFLSSNMVPLTFPDGGAVGEAIGDVVGNSVGNLVGLAVGEPVGDDVGVAVGL